MKLEIHDLPPAAHSVSSAWRRFLGACGGASANFKRPKNVSSNLAVSKGVDAEVFLTASCSTDSCRQGIAQRGSVTASSGQASMYSLSAQLAGNSSSTCALETGCERQPHSRVSSEILSLLPDAPPDASLRAVITEHCLSSAWTKPAPPVRPRGAEDEVSAGAASPHNRMQVALSASSLRDHAQCDPAMRIRHLKPLSYGPDSVVYKGTWQGLLVAVKFMLYRGANPAGLQRRVSALLAAHCMPQRSHLGRVYACDLSEVLHAGHPPPPPPPPPQHSPPQQLPLKQAQPSMSGTLADGMTAHPLCPRPGLTVRPFFPEELEEAVGEAGEPCLAPCAERPSPCAAVDADASGGGFAFGGSGGGSSSGGRRLRGSTACERFHFSSAVFTEPSAPDAHKVADDAGCGPGLSLAGLLEQLGARPGDFLLHCVSELASGGNLWHGIRSGAYDTFGPLGPLGAVRMVLHTARGIAQGLHQLHAAGEVHGGLTPRNVLLLWSHHAQGDGAPGGGGGSGGGTDAACGGGGGDARGLHKRRAFTARVADCGIRRLVLGTDWRSQLDSNPELRGCAAPELLRTKPSSSAAPGQEAAASASIGGEIEWLPCHDVYSFGAVLHVMCTGHHCGGSNDGGSEAAAEPAAAAVWPDHVWYPLRNLSDACMATDPGARPSSGEIVRVLLVLEQRLHNAGGGHTRGFRMRQPRAAPGWGSGPGLGTRSVGLGTGLVAAATGGSHGLHGRGGGGGASVVSQPRANGTEVVTSAFLHATVEEAGQMDGDGGDAGGVGGDGGRAIGLEQTAPALGGTLPRTPLHSGGAQHFALSSMPEVLLRSSVAPSGAQTLAG